VFSFSLRMTSTSGVGSSEAAELSRSRLRESFSSMSGKLTLSPEIIIPEPSDPTALLLQSTQIKNLSEQLRTKAKANSLWMSGSLSSLQQITSEQEEARGSFPGPLPVIYCDYKDKQEDCSFSSIKEAGAEGVLVTVNSQNIVSSPSDFVIDGDVKSEFEGALGCGLQPIPEVLVDARSCSKWGDDDVMALVDNLAMQCGGDPVSIVLSFTVDDNDSGEGDEGEDEGIDLPLISQTVKEKLGILGSVRVLAGENRMGQYLDHLKGKGFSGAVLRCECVPGYRMNPDLEAVTNFWSAAISDLKSTKSKTFSFRSKNNMEKNLSTQWFNYQKDVMSSGALGEESAASVRDMDLDSGDYMGF